MKGETLDGLCPECLLGEGLALENAGELPEGSASGAGASSPRPGTSRFGDYELLEVIAHGGMGMVYKARQVRLNRVVALKMLLFGAHSSPAAVQRLLAEAMATASLHHPNIVAIHEVGFCEGQHFLAMDYVEGRSLSALVGGKPLLPRRAAGYLGTLAQAVHHAHERGILHRDLKPSNVLIDQEDQPRITDFGLAKRLESDSDLTVSGQVLGSPNYMSPEQAGGKRGVLTRRSDIYSLGAMLYELLTGRPPFIGEGLAEIVPQVLDAEPLAPRALNPGVPLDLQKVCLKCLEKDPGKRYPTALALAEDLGRFLEGKPVLARPVGRVEKTWRWCRRQPVRAGLLAGLFLTFALGVLGVLWQWGVAEQQRATAKENELRARQSEYAADISLAQSFLDAGNLGQAVRLLDKYRPNDSLASEADATSPDLRHWEWRYLRRLCQGDEWRTLCRYPTWVNSLQVSSDGQYLAFRKGSSEIVVWGFASRRSLAELPGGGLLRARNLVFVPGSDLLAFGRNGSSGEPEIAIWDAGLSREREHFRVRKPVYALSISPEGRLLAILHAEGEVTILDLASKEVQVELPAGTLADREDGDVKFSRDSDLAFSRDGSRLVIGQLDGRVQVLDWRNGATLVNIPSQDEWNGVVALACSPTGDLFAWSTGYGSTVIRLGNAMSPKPLGTLAGHTDCVVALAFSPDGQFLASAGVDQSIRLWNVAEQKQVRRFQGHLDEVWGVAFLPDGKTLVSGGKDGSVRLWRLDAAQDSGGSTNLPAGAAWCFGFGPDGQSFITSGRDRTLRLWNTNPLKEFERPSFLGSDISGGGLSPDGRWLAVIYPTGTVSVWDWHARRIITNLTIRPNKTGGVLFSARSKYMIANTPAPQGWETANWKSLPNPPDLEGLGVTQCPLSPNEQEWASGHRDGSVKLWTFPDNQPLAEFSGHSGAVVALAFSADGRLLASAGRDGYVNLYDTAARRHLATLRAHSQWARGVCFSPDGRRLATLGTIGDSAKLWDLATLRPLITLTGTARWYFHAEFSPDGGTLVGRDTYGTVDLWHAPSFAELEAVERAKMEPVPHP